MKLLGVSVQPVRPAAPPEPASLEEAFLSLRRVMAALKGRFHAALREHGLTFPQWLVLKFLHRKGRMTAKELAEMMEVTPANVTGIVDRLEREGLAARSRGAQDRRVVYVRLTEEGHAKVEEMLDLAQDVLADMFEGWSRDDLQAFRSLLDRVSLRPDDAQEF